MDFVTITKLLLLACVSYLWFRYKNNLQIKPIYGSQQTDSATGKSRKRKVLYPGPDDLTKVKIDIVAVHGLGSNVDWTWIWKDRTKHVHWLRDPDMLPAALPNARIMVYSYESRWHTKAPKTRLELCGEELMEDLHNFRTKTRDRPVVFIGHSLGGLVVLHCLLFADRIERFKYLPARTVGFLALGTPFRGTKMQTLAEKAAWLMAPAVTQDRHFLVPFGRNENFVGRNSILEQLLSRIPPSAKKDDCQRTAVEGLGGVGKTQVALEAAYRIRDQHPACSVFWVPAVDSISFEKAYREIGKAFGVQGLDDDMANVKSLVKAALSCESIGSWLLIVDNADDLKLLFTDTALADYLPFSRKGSILFTTRNHEAAVRLDIRPIITLKEMNNAEATELLRTGLKENQTNDTESTARLLEFLANLPLAVKQASAYMAKTGISTTKYLRYCQTSNKTMAKLLSQDFEDRGRYRDINNPITTTWLISFNHISRDMPLAAQYLKFICFLAEKDIPISLLPSGKDKLQKDEEEEDEEKEDELKKDEAIGILKGYAFILGRDSPDSFDIHRLVRLAMRNWLQGKGEWQEWTGYVIQRLADKYPFPEHENRTEAEQMHRQALELREAVLGQEHPFTFDSMNNLANVLDSQGKYEEAEQMHRQALELTEAVLGQEHPSTLNSMNNLALVFRSQGKYEEAEQMHRQALKLKEVVLGREHPSTLNSMNNLANVLDSKGKYEEAEQMHRQALKLREAVLGREHPSTLDSMNNLANVLGSQGKYEEAEQMHRQALELTEAVLGREHPSTLDSKNNLANVLDSQGKYEEAEQMHRQALELTEAVLGREHPSTLNSMNNLANVLGNQGKYAEAEQLFR
ncbi:hypothetical protein DL764_000369 [Monosporascus ibericus]|uniref:Uncharacterized protein n=1 Tax=Monosporascus ibericus TaxID=155417 RepID=A0A4Q4TZ47_9PEZI|nr:hypothetical protein DL764_000369 [Monosporascus ibericus]